MELVKDLVLCQKRNRAARVPASACSTEASGSKFHDPARDPQAYRKQARSLGGSTGPQKQRHGSPAWAWERHYLRNMCHLAGHKNLYARGPRTLPRPFSVPRKAKRLKKVSRGWVDREARQASSEFRAGGWEFCSRRKVMLQHAVLIQSFVPGPELAQVNAYAVPRQTARKT